MGPQRPAVGHGEERDADLATVFVHGALDVDADGRRALVQDGELGLVVEQPRHGDALLLAAGEDVHPVGDGVPAAVALLDVRQLDQVQVRHQVRVAHPLGHHVRVSVRVDDLCR